MKQFGIVSLRQEQYETFRDILFHQIILVAVIIN